jgi:aldehyde dehydrogenase (NAD+)
MVASIKPHRDELGLGDGRMLIGGDWVTAADEATWSHVHPATGEQVAEFPVATPADVDRAVKAARQAFDEGPWPHARAGERVRVLHTIADLIREHADELMKLQALDNSVPLSFGEIYAMSPGFVADVFDHHAGWADKIAGETLPPYQGGDHMVLTLREPVGVVGAVIPWNAPLVLFAQKVAPALAAGCTVVLKPSEYATFAVLRLAQLINGVLPAGVLNVVTGPGDPAGQALISHPMVDKLSFTGSRAVGQKVMTAAAAGCKRVSLELGGKSPSVVFADADIGTAAAVTMGTVTLGLSGQVCAAQTRALVHRDAVEEFLATAELIGTMVRYGNPFDPEVTSAPLINTRQLDRVLGLIARGQEEGARLVCGGGRADGVELAHGNFVAPTLFADVSNDMSIAREEIFGPVLSVIPFDGEQEAVRLANDTDYGLAATVWTSDVRRAMRMTKAIKAGTVGVNGYQLEPNSPFGGFRQSGLGREGGRAAIESYTELKTVLLPFTDEMM